MNEVDTAGLIAATLGGDSRSFVALYRRYVRLVASRVIRLIGNRPEVEDVIQEVFTQVHRSLPRFKLDEPFEPWLMRVTRNVAISHRRKASRVLDVSALLAFSGSEDNWARLSARDQVRMLYEALERFSEEEREAFLLHTIEGLTLREIGEMSDTSINTVASRVRRVREQLHEALQAERLKTAAVGGQK